MHLYEKRPVDKPEFVLAIPVARDLLSKHGRHLHEISIQWWERICICDTDVIFLRMGMTSAIIHPCMMILACTRASCPNHCAQW